MEPETLVVLYSKFSPKCKQILDVYTNNPAFEFVCIDNRVIRDKILKAAHINVQSVPCVLFVYPNRTVEKLEGVEVVDWLQSKFGVKSKAPRREMTPPPSPSPSPSPPPRRKRSQKTVRIQTPSPPPKAQYTPLVTEEFDQQVTQTIQKINTKKEKSLAELAAEMAAEREDPDPQPPLNMSRI